MPSNKIISTGLTAKSLGTIFVLCCAALFIQNGSNIFSLLISKNIDFKKVNAATWKANLGNLSPAKYYVSLGRPRGACSLTLDGALIASNQGAEPETRSMLMLGAPLSIIQEAHDSEITVNCLSQQGLKPGLSHTPIVATYRLGLFLQLWRGFTETLLGPIMSLVLLLIVSSKMRSSPASKHAAARHQFSFAVISFLYSLSLAHYPRLFISGMPATVIHLLLRVGFSFTFASLCAFYSKRNLFVDLCHLSLALLFGYVSYEHPKSIEDIYSGLFFLLPIATLVATYVLWKAEERSESIVILKYIAAVWSLVQIADTFEVWFNFGVYVAPAIVTMMAIGIGRMSMKERLRAERIEKTTSRILSAMNAKTSIRDILVQVSSILHGETHFGRISAYLDSFCLGQTDSPRKKLACVMESGYEKDRSKELVIDLMEGHGAVMVQAMSTGEILLDQGKVDFSNYLIVPIGHQACINLSDASPEHPYKVYESLEVVQRIYPALRTLEGKLLDYSLKSGSALEKVRSKKGDGRWEARIGSIFADICDYSLKTERYGACFSDFVSATYFPSLLRHLGKWAVAEFVRGDEIYMVSLREVISDEMSVEHATLAATIALLEFVRNEGVDLCRQNGFSAIEMSVGVNIGEVAIICDPIKVRTAGKVVNDAKRLQEAAGAGVTLVTSEAALLFKDQPAYFGEEAPVLVKKNFIMARRLLNWDTENVAA